MGGAVRRHRLYEGGADRLQRRPHRGHRERRADADRRQLLYRDRTVAAFGGRRRRHPHRSGIRRDRADRGAAGVASEPRQQSCAGGAHRSEGRRHRRAQHHGAVHRRRASAGVTTGEWGAVLREVFGEYRAPTGLQAKRQPDEARLEEVRRRVDEVSGKLGRTLTFVVGKPGLDGHSNGAEQIAVRATDVGMEVVYDGIRLTPAQIVDQAREAARACRRPFHPFRLACRAGARSRAADAGGRARRRADRGRRHHSAGRRQCPEAMRRVARSTRRRTSSSTTS